MKSKWGMNNWLIVGCPLTLIALATIACSSFNQPDAQQLAMTIVAQTASAATPVPPTEPPTAIPTSTQTPPPSSTPLPTETPPPTPTPGPFLFSDDFSAQEDFWAHCDYCDWDAGLLNMGPYPASEAFRQQYTICAPCGPVTNYKMGVDVTYGSGPSERGYGLLLKITKEYLLTLEITPWQDLSVWKYDNKTREWSNIGYKWSGAIRPGRITNRIEAEVTEDRFGKMLIKVMVNGKNALTVEGPENKPGHIGLTLFGHAVAVMFDNFEFTEYEPYLDRNQPVPQWEQGNIGPSLLPV